ncbi:hypothetical protein D9757_003959 [Collybiopsis confluens]|uniref:F-box domain-containing protein n=1 Tax=Collybiopsis confluens TaxID=2823264 RepID=A0A8H5MES7_9AGAR|nr:hypothetical protein D9757_003959 [Collybiopsis confluens]
MSDSALDLLPEEVLERILSLCQISERTLPRPAWLPSPANNGSSSLSQDRRSISATRTRLAPLLVSKKFYRISIPHYHSTVHITSAEKAGAFLRCLQEQEPTIGLYVRTLVSSSVFPLLGAVLQCCPNIRSLDICMDQGPAAVDAATEELCNALDGLQSISHLTLRKASNAYLTLPRVRYILTRLADAVDQWTCLESANIAFRMSNDNPQTLLALAYPFSPHNIYHSLPSTPLSVSSPGPFSSSPAPLTDSPPSSPVRSGPMSLLTTALSKSPSLHTFATHVPNIWNEAILCVSQNPSLQQIVLGDPRIGVMITGLFMSEARKHARLVELIKAGTPMIRTRAQTLGNFGNPVHTAATATHVYDCVKLDSDPAPIPSRHNGMFISTSL